MNIQQTAPETVTAAALNDEDVARYEREGFLVCPSLFGADDLRLVREDIERITREALASGEYADVLEIEPEAVDGKVMARRIYNPFHQGGAFRKLGASPLVLDRIASLIGPEFDLQHSKLNMKPARVGSVVEWHQDLAYFPHTNDSLVTTLVYLDDATEENGCLEVLPGNHHQFLDHFNPDGSFAGMITESIEAASHGAPQPLPAPAGSVIFMHCMLPHRSLPNRSTWPRRTLIFEYRAADAFPIYFGEQMLEVEALACPLRGQRARVARFGGPPPLIPEAQKKHKSLYEMQAAGKK